MAARPPLLLDIERDLLDGKPLADLLRKCMMLGGKSGSKELREWANRELRGYEQEELPKYRLVPASILADASTGSTFVRGQTVPESALPDFVRQAGIGNIIPMRQGVKELETLARQASGKGVNLSLPGAEVIGRYFDSKSGNPFQHTDRIYWSLAPAVIEGILDNVRTTLTELVTELVAEVPAAQEVPTAEQADNALNVAVHGRKSRVTITTSQASGNSVSSIGQNAKPSGENDEPGWWTFGRKVWAVLVSIFVVAGAIAAIIVIYK